MISVRLPACVSLVLVAFGGASVELWADDHVHGQPTATAATEVIEAPKIFLEKSPRIVQYQLGRLDNRRLLLVERKSDDKKYVPVYREILSRPGMSPQHRQEAVGALVKLNGTDPVTELMETLKSIDRDDPTERRTADEIAAMLLGQPDSVLIAAGEVMESALDSENALVRSTGYAGLIAAGKTELAADKSQASSSATLDWLQGVAMVPKASQRADLRAAVLLALSDATEPEVKRSAISTMAVVPGQRGNTFDEIAPLVAENDYRDVAVKTLLKIDAQDRSEQSSAAVLKSLVDYAEQTPAEKRTSGSFVDAMQLADQLMARVPAELVTEYRQRLNAVTVRLVRIRTVEEEMRYDLPYFAVEAGRPVQIVLENHDLMPHNLVITVPGALKEIAQLGLQVGPNGGWRGLPYVPESEKVLHATGLVPADQNVRLTFDAPSEPGEYPYVCTFPQHWYRMYGVMVVVKDLDAWLKDPVEPANPIGSNRSFVQAWTVDDLKDKLDDGLRGRSAEIGKRLFSEASCAGCHKIQGEGGVIGPELTDVIARWKGDRVGVLREILDPSHKIDPKYTMQRILTVDGRTITGVLVSENEDQVTLLSSADAKEPTVVLQDEIEAMVPSNVSMMPKALLDQYTQDEIFELLGYMLSVAPQH